MQTDEHFACSVEILLDTHAYKFVIYGYFPALVTQEVNCELHECVVWWWWRGGASDNI